jgi:hypothetical protein
MGMRLRRGDPSGPRKPASLTQPPSAPYRRPGAGQGCRCRRGAARGAIVRRYHLRKGILTNSSHPRRLSPTASTSTATRSPCTHPPSATGSWTRSATPGSPSPQAVARPSKASKARSGSSPTPTPENLRTLGIYVYPSADALVLGSPGKTSPAAALTRKGHADQHDRGRNRPHPNPSRRGCPRHSHSTTSSPRCDVHDSMTSNVASGFSRVMTTSEISARNRSPAGPSPARQNRPPGDLRLARPPGLLALLRRAVGPQRHDRLGRPASNSRRTRAANSGSARSTSFHAATAPVCARSPSVHRQPVLISGHRYR